jgi:phosphoribosyl 1,2-cyclic phosphodiesterase
MMRFASLGSGSAGNALIVESLSARVMLDCGFSIKETELRLARLNISPETLTGIVITHEHDDHAGGAFKFAAKYQIPVWLTYGTLKMAERYMPASHKLQLHEVDAHQNFHIGDLEVSPFPVPHDAREPMQCVFGDGKSRLGVLTDVGRTTPHIENMLTKCDALVLECNHDAQMLQTGPYSSSLKKRVGGDWGHLENQVSAALLAKLDNSKLKHLVAAHLSAKNNTVHLAKTALANVMHCTLDWIQVADQREGLEWRAVV